MSNQQFDRMSVILDANPLGGRGPAARQGGGRLPVVDNTIRCVLDMDTNKNH